MPVSTELWIFLWSICGGIILGFVFDLFRIKRRLIKTGIAIITIEDLLYWTFAALLFFLTLYLSNEGQMRWFSIFGSILGAAFYLSAISPLVLKVSVAVIEAIVRSIRFMVKVLTWPVIFMIKLLTPIVVFIKRFLGNIFGKFKSTVNNNTKAFVGKIFSKRRQKHAVDGDKRGKVFLIKKKIKKFKRKFSLKKRKKEGN